VYGNFAHSVVKMKRQQR